MSDNFLNDEIFSNFKKPKKIIFISELPRNAMVKVQKQRLRNIYNNLFD
jgi:acyl-coenzyme A synthetase/AMP-(fatty) acid ligase